MNDDDARQLFDGLVELLSDERYEGRLAALVSDVRNAISRGRPAGAEVTIAGKRTRERVRRVEPLNSRERLGLLVRAVNLALVAPVDLAAATVSNLVTEELPVIDLVFEDDPADETIDSPRNVARRTPPSDGVEPVLIPAAQIEQAVRAVEPLRSALATIQAALNS